MYRFTGMLCAGGLMLLSVGCWLDRQDLDVRAGATVQGADDGTTGNLTYVQGSFESVALSTQNALRRLCSDVKATPDGQSVRLSATTRGGKHFDLILTRHPTATGEDTQLRIKWENNAEAFFLESVVRELYSRSAPPVEEGPPH
jgi:hypothetical protein